MGRCPVQNPFKTEYFMCPFQDVMLFDSGLQKSDAHSQILLLGRREGVGVLDRVRAEDLSEPLT